MSTDKIVIKALTLMDPWTFIMIIYVGQVICILIGIVLVIYYIIKAIPRDLFKKWTNKQIDNHEIDSEIIT